jgi:hypothetical protein
MELVTEIGARQFHHVKNENEVLEYENDRNVLVLFMYCMHYAD